ncbi:DNA-3-methyladenine glycosylase 2 [Burkholderiaceae bacterium DAT-1]|nr:DNA-3-methyladenine glycosylase 2 [Burkholderiaceae bacterium DAT-1]
MACMMLDDDNCYAALISRDARFDGRFFTGVTSTGIYCRSVCSARKPKRENCTFFPHAAAAEQAGFRPCLICRPELAPGQSLLESSSRLAWAAAQRIEAGALDMLGVEGLAARLGITDRHLRRIFAEAFGVTPIAYAQTQRLLIAKRLLMDTQLSVTRIAEASGFASLRRFNDAFSEHYQLPPSALRKTRSTPAGEGICLSLSFRPPFDWAHLLGFLASRCIKGVEIVADGCYRRSVRLMRGGQVFTGWLSVCMNNKGNALSVTLSDSLLPVLPDVLARLRRLFDLAADPDAIAAVLGPLASDAPGVRLPGAFDGFEMTMRAILGQQVTVKAAHTLAGRFVQAFGEPIVTPFADIYTVFPSPERVAGLDTALIGELGIVRQRGQAMIELAKRVASDELDLEPAADVDKTLTQLEAIPGIGRWTSHYIAMRALAWPDAWPSGDVALIKALGATSAKSADVMVEQWRPWRAYAVIHLWRSLAKLPATNSMPQSNSDQHQSTTRDAS